jgi:DNA-binding transcriptional regulator YbjK
MPSGLDKLMEEAIADAFSESCEVTRAAELASILSSLVSTTGRYVAILDMLDETEPMVDECINELRMSYKQMKIDIKNDPKLMNHLYKIKHRGKVWN